MPRWSTTGATDVLWRLIIPLLRNVLIPAGGLYGMVTDRPLTEWAAGAYLMMMSVPFAAKIDQLREGRGAAGPTDTSPPRPPEPPGLS